MKKLFRLVAAVVLLSAGCVLAGPRDAAAAIPSSEACGFTDVISSGQFAGNICWMAANKVTTGMTATTYAPKSPVTREAMAAFMYRLAGVSYTPPSESSFTDVAPTGPDANQFYQEIEWMNAQSITHGMTATTYAPKSPVTREAMAAFLYRLAGSPSYTPPSKPSFSDVSQTGSNANQFYLEIEWMNAKGITTGMTPTTYAPKSPVTREAMSAFMYRLANLHLYCGQYSNGVECVPGTPFTWEPVPTISGTTNVGQVLTAQPGSWIPARTVSYQWLRGGVAIAGATASTYTLTSADLNHTITVAVTGTAQGLAAVTMTSPPTAVVTPAPPAPDLSIQTDLTLTGSGSGWHGKLVIQDGNAAVSFGIQHQARSTWGPCNGKDCLVFESVSNSPSYHDYEAPGTVAVTPGAHTIRLDWYQAQGIAKGYCDGVFIGQVAVQPMSGQIVMSEEAVPALAGDYVDANFANIKYNPITALGTYHTDSNTYAWAGTVGCWPGGTNYGTFTCTQTASGFHLYGTATFAGCSGNNWDSCPLVGVRAWTTWNKK